MSPRPRTPAPAPQHVNEITLVGRVPAPAQSRILPSGDEVVVVRLVVDRPERQRVREDRPRTRLDTFDIACWTARTRARAIALEVGDVVTVEGALRRRFHRGAEGAVSRYEVEASRVRREWRPRPEQDQRAQARGSGLAD